MKNRFISVVVLASLSCWSFPTASAVVSQPRSQSMQEPRQTSAHESHDHSCCPDIHLYRSRLFELTPASSPCEQHPCCVKQMPENTASGSPVTRIPRPDSKGGHEAVTNQSGDDRMHGAGSFANRALQSYPTFSAVLRI